MDLVAQTLTTWYKTDQIYINNYHNQKIMINVGVLLPAVTRTSVLASWNSNHLCHVRDWCLTFCFYLSVGKTQWEGNVLTWPSHHMYITSGITSPQHGCGTTKKFIDLTQIWGQPCRWNGPVSHISEHIKECHCYLWPCHAQWLLLLSIQPYHNHWIQSDNTLALTKVLHYIIGVTHKTIKTNLCQNLSIW